MTFIQGCGMVVLLTIVTAEWVMLNKVLSQIQTMLGF